ncbi:NAD(P)/FAD-dependent oxidoreductase, partial [Candidatus Hydrogenedentota bacterium]
MQTNVTIIGAGVVGLAVAAEFSKNSCDIVVLEKHPSFGQETSSRNSEVIHAGLYYLQDSLRGRLCVEGKRLLYKFCEEADIPHRRIGKLIVATTPQESEYLDTIHLWGVQNGVNDLEFLTAGEVSDQYPTVKGIRALFSPSTGIIDSHALMKRLERQAIGNGALMAYNTEVTDITKMQCGYTLEIREADGTSAELASDIVINCAGLQADRVAEMVGIDRNQYGYKQTLSKGEYFRLGSRSSVPGDVLVYRARPSGIIGIHTVID